MQPDNCSAKCWIVGNIANILQRPAGLNCYYESVIRAALLLWRTCGCSCIACSERVPCSCQRFIPILAIPRNWNAKHARRIYLSWRMNAKRFQKWSWLLRSKAAMIIKKQQTFIQWFVLHRQGFLCSLKTFCTDFIAQVESIGSELWKAAFSQLRQ